MAGCLLNTDLNRITRGDVKSTILTVIVHLLLPLSFFPVAFFVVPSFVKKSEELSIEIPALVALVFDLSAFVSQYWYFYLLILALAAMIDAVICLSVYRFKIQSISHLWSGSVILVETACFGLCVWALLLSLHHISNAPQLCPI